MFEIIFEDDLYFDMAMFFSVDDKLRTGGRLVITIEKETGKAYLTVVGDDENGDEFFYAESDVPIRWAAKIAMATIRKRQKH